jgi:hypothetical protein
MPDRVRTHSFAKSTDFPSSARVFDGADCAAQLGQTRKRPIAV